MGDNIKKPDHYCEGRKYEPKDVIRDWGLNFNLGSAVKYISRAGRKGDKLEDLQKAKQFLEFEIEALTKETMRHVDPYNYTNYEDVFKAIRKNKECNSDAKEHKDDIGMTCKEAAEIGEVIAKGFKEGIEEAQSKDDVTCGMVCTCDVLNGNMKFEDVPEDLKPLVFKGVADEVLNGMVDISDDILSDELREKIIDYAIEKLESGDLSPFDLPTYIMDHPRVTDWGASLQKILHRIHIEDSVEITFKF